MRRWNPDTRLFYLGNRRSSLLPSFDWEESRVVLDEMGGLTSRLPAILGEADGSTPPGMVVVEGIADFLNSSADLLLQDMIKAVVAQGHLVVSDGEPFALSASFPLMVAARSSRRGIVLQPEQADGILFRTQFPPECVGPTFPPDVDFMCPRAASQS